MTTLRSFRPEVGRLWVRRAFRSWPGCAERWIDLTDGTVRRRGDAAELPTADEVGSGGLLYVPRVGAEHAAERDALVEELGRRDVSMLVQLAPGEVLAGAAGGVEAVVVDLLGTLLSRDLDRLDALPRDAVALWPLVTGLTDDESLWQEGCRRLAAAGAAGVQSIVPQLEPEDRRELAGEDGGEAVFSRVFHGRAGGERGFAAVAARHGLDVFFRRRRRGSDRRSRNAELAELLALGGELWLRLGRSEVQGQELFRASRWVEDASIDLRSLAVEGNLEIAEALRGTVTASIVGEWARSEASTTVEAWLAEYVTDPGA